MLKNIKSTYFIKLIFSHFHDKTCLNLIKYNKALQNINNITPLNYKLFSRKYIIYESSNQVKEYNYINHKLVYEGGYSNKKKNGKGKEYDSVYSKLIYEGEFLDGKRNGKGKEYGKYKSGNILMFKGEFLNGKKWNGKVFDILDNNISYILKEGKGFVKEYNGQSHLVFEGEFLNGERYKGKEYYDDGKLKFKGEYYNGRKWNGKVYDKKNRIMCELKNGNGFLREEYDDVPTLNFECNFVNGTINGHTKEYFQKSKIFEGEFKNGSRIGKGKLFNYINGNVTFEGEYLYEYKIRGKEFIKKKLAYEGEFLFDRKWNGKGYDGNGNVIYELVNGKGKVKEYSLYNEILVFDGEYLNGDKTGKGKEFNRYSGDLEFEGEYLNGKRNGKGKEYDEDGELIYEGEYLNGKRTGKGKEYKNGKLIFKGDFYDGKLKG